MFIDFFYFFLILIFFFLGGGVCLWPSKIVGNQNSLRSGQRQMAGAVVWQWVHTYLQRGSAPPPIRKPLGGNNSLTHRSLDIGRGEIQRWWAMLRKLDVLINSMGVIHVHLIGIECIYE